MKIEVARVIGAVVREVRACELEGKPARAVIASRAYDTTIEDLWEAITTAERIPRWLAPVTGDLKLGGRYQIKGNAGGTIKECEPPRRFAVTWEYAGAVSWLTVQLTAESRDRTLLSLEHVQPVSDHWTRFGPGATGVGWDLMLAGLERHVSSGAAVDPTEAMAWMGSAEGKDFLRTSSNAWFRADVASGVIEEPAAKEAAARTLAAYGGEG